MGIIYTHPSGLFAVSYNSGQGTYTVLRRHADGWLKVYECDWKVAAIEKCRMLASGEEPKVAATKPPDDRSRISLLAH